MSLSSHQTHPSQSESIDIITKHNKTFTFKLKRGATIADVKEKVFNTYGLLPGDQYYNAPKDATILTDTTDVWSKLQHSAMNKLYLRIDEHLKLKELKRESKKIVEAGGKDIADNSVMAFTTSVVNTSCKTVTNLHSAIPFVNKDAVHRNELRMLKRARRKREAAKDKYKGSVVAQIACTSVNMARNAVEGLARSDVDVDEMKEAYERVGD